MDFSQVRYFLTLTETLNFTRAAEQCHVTQPSLTQSIRRLEDELGGDLIHRDGRNTRLTGLGRTLREHFQKIEQTGRSKNVQNLNLGGAITAVSYWVVTK